MTKKNGPLNADFRLSSFVLRPFQRSFHLNTREFAIALAQQAGELLLDYRRRGLAEDTIRTKTGHFDIVTEADVASERLIFSAIREAFPDHGFHGEESAGHRLPAESWFWVVDPLDGTTNFAHGLPIYGVNMALIHDGLPVLGVTCDPSSGRTYWAERGGGAWVRFGGQDTRLSVSTIANLDRALLSTGFIAGRKLDPSHNRAEFTALDLPLAVGEAARLGGGGVGVGGCRSPGSVLGRAAQALGLDTGLAPDRGSRRPRHRARWGCGRAFERQPGGQQRTTGDPRRDPGDHRRAFGRRAFNAETSHGAGMYLDRRYRGRQPRSPWPIIVLIALILVPGIYLLATRTRFFENPFNPLQPTPTPTRSAVSYLAEVEDDYKAGRLAAAAEGYQRVIELEPTNDEALRQIAWLWILRGKPERAVEPARKALEINDSALNGAILAMALDWTSQYDEAIKVALAAVDKDPLSAEAHAALAEVYADRNNWTRALEEAEQAVKLDPDNAFVQRNMGYVLSMQGRYDDALDTYAKAAELAPKLGYIYISAGNIYMALNQYEDAIAQFEKAVQANPDTPVGYDLLGHASALNGDPDRAISTLRKAIELDPEYALAYAHLGRVYYTLLNWESAIENFNKAFAMGLKNEEYFYELGLAYSYLEDCANARIWLEKALEENPDSRPAQDGLKRCAGK